MTDSTLPAFEEVPGAATEQAPHAAITEGGPLAVEEEMAQNAVAACSPHAAITEMAPPIDGEFFLHRDSPIDPPPLNGPSTETLIREIHEVVTRIVPLVQRAEEIIDPLAEEISTKGIAGLIPLILGSIRK